MKRIPVKASKLVGFPCRIRIKPAPKSRKRRRKVSRQRWRKLKADAEAIEIVRIDVVEHECLPGWCFQITNLFDRRTQTAIVRIELVPGSSGRSGLSRL